MSSDDDTAVHQIPDELSAWLVIAPDGFRMSFARELDAERWKGRCGGTIHALHAEAHRDEPHL